MMMTTSSSARAIHKRLQLRPAQVIEQRKPEVRQVLAKVVVNQGEAVMP